MSHFEIGKIVNTRGLNGEVKIMPWTDDPKRFETLKTIDCYDGDVLKASYTIVKVDYHRQLVMLKLKEINDINAAEALKGLIIKIPVELGLPLEEDQYYIRDLFGLKVQTEDKIQLGTIKDVIQTGANDVYVVSRAGQKDLLIPAIKQCILDVDIQNGVITVHLLNGLEEV